MVQNLRTEARSEIDRYLEAGRWQQAHAALHGLWNHERSSAAASFIISRHERLRRFLNLTPCRLAILRSFTVEPAVPLLRAMALLNGIDLTVQLGGFDTYAQQILDPDSELYKFRPDVAILALQTRDVAPRIWDSYTDMSSEERAAAIEETSVNIGEWARIFRSRSTASLILHTFEKPVYPSAGVLDSQNTAGQIAAVQEINNRLQALAAESTGMYVLDYDGLVSRYGRERWHDERKWLVMRMPISADHLFPMAQEWFRFIRPLTGKIGKVLVTDLDNTLWAGVLGEDGIQGIQVGQDYPGAAFLNVQRALLDLRNRGILLAVSSKNNEDEALQALKNHPGMLLRPSHFASLHLNWNSKVESLRRIAEELNVGLDSLVFLDDNPVERQNIRVALPEVTVIELPEDIMSYANAVKQCPAFERLTLSTEDRDRGVYYAQQQQRKELQHNTSSLEDFYYSLQQQVEISRVSHNSVPRVAQLIQKTNQFNLTTRRHTATQISEFAADPRYDVYHARVIDRFGDNGIVGVCITKREGDLCEIDTFLLSCRVIGRTVEDAILHFIVAENRLRNVHRIQGWFLPTRKNGPAESFYPSRGFSLLDQTEAGTLWMLDLRTAAIDCPPWIKLAAQGVRQEQWAHA